MHIDARLFDYVETEKERIALEAIQKHDTCQSADEALGKARSYCSGKLNQVKRRAAKNGYFPQTSNMETNAPAGFAVKRISSRHDAEGSHAGGWTIYEPDKLQAEAALTEAIGALCDDIKGKSPLILPPSLSDEELLTVIPMGDPHFGLLSWKPETGEDFNTAKAEDITFGSVDRLAALTPETETALLLNLGDYFHADDSTNRTPRGQNILDTDTRFAKIASVGFRAMIRCIERMLEKHNKVIVRNNPGNHDPHQAKMLNIAVGAYFHNNERVMVDPSPSSFYYHRFGKCLIGSTHGDGAKLNDLPLIMANDVPKDWAEAIFRVWHVGHFHHNQRIGQKDLVGCEVETHRTTAAGDAWHRHHGYRSLRDMKAIVYHRDFGEVNRIRCGVEMLENAA